MKRGLNLSLPQSYYRIQSRFRVEFPQLQCDNYLVASFRDKWSNCASGIEVGLE